MPFSEFVAIREGLNLPNRPPSKGLSRINPFPTTNIHRRRMQPLPFPLPLRKVAEFFSKGEKLPASALALQELQQAQPRRQGLETT